MPDTQQNRSYFVNCNEIQDALKYDQEKHQNIIDAIEDGVTIVGLEGKILDCNKASYKQLGLTREELIGKNVYDIVVPEDRQRAMEGALKVLQTGKVLNQVGVLRKDNSTFYAEISVTALYDKNGKPTSFLGVVRDISERKKTEDRLKQSEQFYHTFFDNSDDGFLLAEPVYDETGKAIDFRFLNVNLAYERQTGIKKTVVEGKRAKEIEQNLAPEWISLVGMVAKSGKSMRYENYNRHTERWYDASYFLYSKGQVGILFRDITERKKTEETLKIEKERFRSLADSLPEIVFETDANGNLLFANASGFEITGYSKEEFDKGFDVFNLIAPQDKEKVIDDFKKTLNNQPTPYNEFTVMRKDGSTFPAIIVANPIVNEGHPTGLRGLVIDITERKKAEEALRRTEEKLQKIIDQSPVVFELYDKSGFQVQVNPAWDKLWGVPREFTLGKYNILQSEQVIKNGWVPFIKRAYAGEIVKVPDLEYDAALDPSTKGLGRKRWLSTVIYPIRDESGHVTNIAILHEDITEQKVLQEQLKSQERLAYIGQTAGMVGHDLRNPLQTISGEVYLAKNELESMPEGENKSCLQESVRTIEEQISYMDKIVLDLQTFVRPVEAQKQFVSLNPLITSVLAQGAIPSNIQVNILIQERLTAYTDPLLLKRVLVNLVTNAVQAMPEGGQLAVKAEKNNEDKIQISVEDTGTGIPEEIKSKIFTPLFTTKSKGQGFGLAVCKRVIEAQGGTITFESQVDKGTKFMVTLPIRK